MRPAANQAQRIVALARLMEADGLDLLAVSDHPHDPASLESWTLLTYLASQTGHLTFVPAVANLGLRAPALLARSAATLDILTRGRIEIGLGAGGFGDDLAAMGGPVRTPEQALDAVAEAIEVMRALWSDAPSVEFDGEYYALRGARPGPKPAHPIGIWLGAYGPRFLRMTGRLADGWLGDATRGEPEQLPAFMRAIDEAATAAGREPARIRRVYIVDAAMTAAQLTDLALSEGISGFLLPVLPDAEAEAARFATETAPAVRSAVAAARGESAP
ncbi:LLM class flavin-dependent oxidoreductase [Nocardia inohanensis]|uniref:LLM class flavin-dependent oxidoreductase n=1 Tax=Nocardia inohanensis TaxID=209246 RepID=UPI000AE54507|nr:LLM class flavin-dependent oxidoreductase [Nocardia inohanensis]